MGCSSAKSNQQPIVCKPANSPSPPQSTVPAVPRLLSTRWIPSAGISFTQGIAHLKPEVQIWTNLWTDLRLRDSFEVAVHGSDIDKVIIGVLETANKGKSPGLRLGKGRGFDVYSYEGVGYVHTQYREYSYNSEQWKFSADDVIRVDIEVGSISFFKNGKKMYKHENVPDRQMSAFISLGSEQVQVEVRS